MTSTPVPTAHSLEIRRTFEAPRERVYRAWTEPAALARWFAPSEQYSVFVHALDLRVGGAYRIEMRHDSGRSSVVLGTYRALEPPERLVFTWRWEQEPATAETLVTVTLAARAGATELVLRHELFATAAAAGEHDKGWSGCFELLKKAL